MIRFISHVRARPRLLMATLVRFVAFWLSPVSGYVIPRILIGWNVTAWLYLALIGTMMLRADHARLRRVAVLQDGGATTVLILVILGAGANLLQFERQFLPNDYTVVPSCVLYVLSGVFHDGLLVD